MYSGGEEVLLDVGGQDATEPFEDVGHSDEAREILEGLLVGKLKRVVCSILEAQKTFVGPAVQSVHVFPQLQCAPVRLWG